MSKKNCNFRFSLRSLLLAPLVVAAACWWMTWPERTAAHYNRLIAEGRTSEARSMIVWDGVHGDAPYDVKVRKPSPLDLLLARREVGEDLAKDGGLMTIDVVRGSVVLRFTPPRRSLRQSEGKIAILPGGRLVAIPNRPWTFKPMKSTGNLRRDFEEWNREP